MSAPSALTALPDAAAAQRLFTRASRSFEAGSFIHDRAREILLSRLDYLPVEPRVVLDLGCAVGQAFGPLRARWPEALLIGLDCNLSMCRAAGERSQADGATMLLAANAEHIPIRDRSVDLLFANMLLPWCLPERIFAETARVLSADGLVLFATLGPGSLAELRRAWSKVDESIHVHAAFDIHDLGDLAARAGLSEPVLDVERLSLTYAEVGDLVRDLRACGATNTAPGRRKSLTGRGRWRRFEDALAQESGGGRLKVTIELILGQAFGRRNPALRGDVTAVPVSAITRRP